MGFTVELRDDVRHVDRGRALLGGSPVRVVRLTPRARELLGCEKGLSDAALELLGERYDDARARAIGLDAKHAGDGSPPRSNPSSEVWKLVDRIRDV
jgi:hypothetical protein